MTAAGRNLTIAAIACGVLGAGAAIYALVFGGGGGRAPTYAATTPVPSAPRPHAAASPDAAAEASFEIVDTSGTVEIRRGGVWIPAKRGDRVLASEAIRTGEGASATLHTASGEELALREKVELQVSQLDESVTALTLTRGKVKAQAAPGDARFEITAGGARAVTNNGARFTVYADPRGAVAIASDEGDVQVVAGGRAVKVGPKQQTYVPPGGVPGDPVAVPDAVLLSVAWPADEVHARRVQVRGRAAPGSIVKVNGAETAVNDEGVFEADVTLRDGPNPVVIVAEGVTGKTTERDGTVRAQTKGPPVTADPTHMYDPPPQQPPPQRPPSPKPNPKSRPR